MRKLVATVIGTEDVMDGSVKGALVLHRNATVIKALSAHLFSMAMVWWTTLLCRSHITERSLCYPLGGQLLQLIIGDSSQSEP